MKKAATSISLTNRIRVALTGETLDINLSVRIPANYSNQKIECYHHEQRVWEEMIESNSFLSDKQVVVKIKMHNTSSSGDYSCRYANQKVHWVILVRGKSEDYLNYTRITLTQCTVMYDFDMYNLLIFNLVCTHLNISLFECVAYPHNRQIGPMNRLKQ